MSNILQLTYQMKMLKKHRQDHAAHNQPPQHIYLQQFYFRSESPGNCHQFGGYLRDHAQQRHNLQCFQQYRLSEPNERQCGLPGQRTLCEFLIQCGNPEEQHFDQPVLLHAYLSFSLLFPRLFQSDQLQYLFRQ